MFEFKPGECVLEEGKPRAQPKWYVVAKGSCSISRRDAASGETQQLGQLYHGSHFGERSILRGDECSEFTAHAGTEGLTVLAFDRDILKHVASRLDNEAYNAFDCDPGNDEGCSPESLRNIAMSAKPDEYMKVVCSDMQNRGVTGPAAEPAGVLEPVSRLGEGGFGDVFLVRSRVTQQRYALKQISIAKCRETGALDQVRTERDIMARMDTPFIVHFFGAFTDEVNIFFVMEAVTGGHLFGLLCDHSDVLFSDSRPRGSAAMFYIACVTLALGHLHERFIAYRDIKMENVLLDSCGYAKLCDMGFARFVLGKTNTFLGTPDYMAPEIIDPPHAHDKNVDWFALGVLACELLTGQGPWDYHAESCGNPLEMMLAIRECHSAGLPAGLLPGRQPQAQDLISQLLREKPRSRLGSGQGDAAEVTAHRWFSSNGFDFQALRERQLASPWTPPASPAEPEPQDGTAPARPPPRGWAMNGGQVQEFV
jgi:serine/threonine protein kinase